MRRDYAAAAAIVLQPLAALTGAVLDEDTAGIFVALDGNTREGAPDDTSGALSRLIGRPTTTPLAQTPRSLVWRAGPARSGQGA